MLHDGLPLSANGRIAAEVINCHLRNSILSSKRSYIFAIIRFVDIDLQRVLRSFAYGPSF
jgi:hypothetical protein